MAWLPAAVIIVILGGVADRGYTLQRETRRDTDPSLAGEASQDVNPIRELDATSWPSCRVTARSRRVEEGGGGGRSRGIVIFERRRRILR